MYVGVLGLGGIAAVSVCVEITIVGNNGNAMSETGKRKTLPTLLTVTLAREAK